MSATSPDAGVVPALVLERLSKVYAGGRRAVDAVDLRVEDGEVFGLLGPNGAGKTTIIKMVMTLTRPTAGRIMVYGKDGVGFSGRTRSLTGYVPQEVSVDGDLTARENLLIFAKLYGVSGSIRKSRIEEALSSMELEDRSGELVKNYSGGMMRRLEIAQALVSRPKMLLLDEPSLGLDPGAKREVWKRVEVLNRESKMTILAATHDMAEADHLCNRLAIMNEGRIVVSGSPEDLKRTVGGEVVVVRRGSADGSVRLPPEIMPREISPDQPERMPGEEALDQISIGVEGAKALPKIIAAYEQAGVPIESISVNRPTLDDVFLKYAKVRMGSGEAPGAGKRERRRAIRRAR